PLEDRKSGDGPGRADCPCRSNTELACRHAGLDAFADGEFMANRIEHDCRAMHYAEHAAINLRAVRVERDTLDCGDRAVVDAAEPRDQCGHAISLAGVFISPRAGRMKAQHAASKIVIEFKLAVDVEISFGERSPRLYRFVPDCGCAFDAEMIILAARSL